MKVLLTYLVLALTYTGCCKLISFEHGHDHSQITPLKEDTIKIEMIPLETHKMPVYVEYFKDGQLLLPDMVCPDTVIVVDAIGFNWDMTYVEQGLIEATDDQLDSIRHKHCIDYKELIKTL